MGSDSTVRTQLCIHAHRPTCTYYIYSAKFSRSTIFAVLSSLFCGSTVRGSGGVDHWPDFQYASNVEDFARERIVSTDVEMISEGSVLRRHCASVMCTRTEAALHINGRDHERRQVPCEQSFGDLGTSHLCLPCQDSRGEMC